METARHSFHLTNTAQESPGSQTLLLSAKIEKKTQARPHGAHRWVRKTNTWMCRTAGTSHPGPRSFSTPTRSFVVRGGQPISGPPPLHTPPRSTQPPRAPPPPSLQLDLALCAWFPFSDHSSHLNSKVGISTLCLHPGWLGQTPTKHNQPVGHFSFPTMPHSCCRGWRTSQDPRARGCVPRAREGGAGFIPPCQEDKAITSHSTERGLASLRRARRHERAVIIICLMN